MWVAALGFMRKYGFFDEDILNLSVDSVYFEMTREEKVKRIESLQCTHFIDDLEEIFLHHEMAQTPISPSKLFFFCKTAVFL